MGNFEKLSVLVIVVIIVMILVVAIYEWTGSPDEASTDPASTTAASAPVAPPDPLLSPAGALPPGAPLPVAGGPGSLTTPTAPLAAASGAKAPGAGDPAAWWDSTKLIPEGATPAAPAGTTPAAAGVAGPALPGTAPADPLLAGTAAPGAAAAATAGEMAETTHVVASGDTLGGISKKYYGKASLYPRIEEANPGVSARDLRVGMKLKIPAMKTDGSKPAVELASATTTGASSEPEAVKDGPVPGKEYKVKSSDTWERISKAAYKTSERWPEIYMKNMKLTPSPKDLRANLVIMIPK
ncbi:MAG: LysM peptidoglycan-binding domain-containing protein [Planctomycetia bacterium]